MFDLNIGLLKNIGLTNAIKSQVLQAAKSGTSVLGAIPTDELNKVLGDAGVEALADSALSSAGGATGANQQTQNVQNSVNNLLDIALNGKSLLSGGLLGGLGGK